jgi:hypothetical protein
LKEEGFWYPTRARRHPPAIPKKAALETETAIQRHLQGIASYGKRERERERESGGGAKG